MFTGKPNSNTFIWHIFIQILFSLGLTGTSQKLKVKKLRKGMSPCVFSLYHRRHKPVKSAVEPFRYFLFCNLQSGDKSQGFKTLQGWWFWFCFVWVFFFFHFYGCFFSFDYKGKLNLIVHWP